MNQIPDILDIPDISNILDIYLQPSYAIAASVAWFLSGGFAMAGAITRTRCMVVATMVSLTFYSIVRYSMICYGNPSPGPDVRS